jgi:glycosyltransferase involved in cell wall biosynthesis
VGGIPDVVEDGTSGLLVPPGDSGALADALVRVLSDRGLAERLGREGHSRVSAWTASPAEFARRMRELVDRTLA